MAKDPNAIVFSQTIDKSSRAEFDAFANKLDAYALKKNMKTPNRGDILRYMIKKGAVDENIEDYFVNK